jgi:spore coat protein U-like protein
MKTRTTRLTLLTCALLTTSIGVQAVKCTVTTSGLNFGNYNIFNTANIDITGIITVNCTNKAPYTLSLSTGSGSFASRSMKNGTNILSYNLFLDSTRLTIWGDGSSGTSTVSGTGTGANAAATVYGRIPARQNARVGSYSDVITVTVTY